MRLTVSALALLLSVALAGAQDPAPKGVDAIAGRITEIDKQAAELAKQRAVLVGDLKTELKRIADLVEKLNLTSPAPTPPTPPVPPVPVDPLKAKLKAAFDADPAPLDTRKGQALDLAALYRLAAPLATNTTTVVNPIDGTESKVYVFLTSGELLNKYRESSLNMVGENALVGVRKVVSTELGALLPTNADLTADQRAAVAALFAKLATAIEEVAK